MFLFPNMSELVKQCLRLEVLGETWEQYWKLKLHMGSQGNKVDSYVKGEKLFEKIFSSAAMGLMACRERLFTRAVKSNGCMVNKLFLSGEETWQGSKQ